MEDDHLVDTQERALQADFVEECAESSPPSRPSPACVCLHRHLAARREYPVAAVSRQPGQRDPAKRPGQAVLQDGEPVCRAALVGGDDTFQRDRRIGDVGVDDVTAMQEIPKLLWKAIDSASSDNCCGAARVRSHSTPR